MRRRCISSAHVWVITFEDVTGKRMPLIDQFGMHAFFTRRLADKEAARCRAEDREAGCDTQIKVIKYIAGEPIR